MSSHVKQTRYWMFTINNPEPEDDPNTWTGYEYIVWQSEMATTLHYQGYIIFSSLKRLSSLKKYNKRAHWEPRQGTHEQALAYCTKTETRVEGPWTLGTPPPPSQQGKRTDLEKLKTDMDSGKSLFEISSEHTALYLRHSRSIKEYLFLRQPRRSFKTIVTISYGPAGVGKTRDLFKHYPDAYFKNRTKWWDNYDGQEHVIIDDYYGNFKFSFLLSLLDRYPLLVESKGGTVQFRSKYVHFTSNKSWEEWYPKATSNSHLYSAFDRRIDLILRYTQLDVPPIIEKCTEEAHELQYIFRPAA